MLGAGHRTGRLSFLSGPLDPQLLHHDAARNNSASSVYTKLSIIHCDSFTLFCCVDTVTLRKIVFIEDKLCVPVLKPDENRSRRRIPLL